MEEVDKGGTVELEEMMGRQVEITTKKDDKIYTHLGILTDVVFAYIYLQSPDGSGAWIPKKSITNVKEVKSA